MVIIRIGGLSIFPESVMTVESFETSESKDGYKVSMGVSTDFDSGEEVVNFFNSYVKPRIDVQPQTYGSSDAARTQVASTDSPAMYGKGELEGEWAVNPAALMEKYSDPEDGFEEHVEDITAMTLAAVSLSQTDEHEGHRYDFYRSIVAETEAVDMEDDPGPIQIPIEEELSGPVERYGEQVFEELGIETGDVEEDEELYERVHRDILSGTIPESKRRLELVEDPDYSALLEAEQEGENRVTMKRFLEEKEEKSEE